MTSRVEDRVSLLPDQEAEEGPEGFVVIGTPLPVRNQVSSGIVGAGFNPGETLNAIHSWNINTVVEGVNASVVVGIQVFNATKCSLVPSSFDIRGGIAETDVPVVKPGESEFMIVRGHRGLFRCNDSWGSISWKVDRTFVCLGWMSPKCRLCQNNWLMLGTTKQLPEEKEIYPQMYYGRNEPDSWFERKSFKCHQDPEAIRQTKNGLHVNADMSTGRKSIIRLVVMPLYEENMAPLSYQYEKGLFNTE